MSSLLLNIRRGSNPFYRRVRRCAHPAMADIKPVRICRQAHGEPVPERLIERFQRLAIRRSSSGQGRVGSYTVST
jgi:hypothetical protein